MADYAALVTEHAELGRIEGRLLGIEKLWAKLETWLAWLKGGWAALVAGYLYVCKML